MHCLVMTDLTEQRRQSDAIAVERAAMHARLVITDRMLSMGTVAAGVAHEINNPLSYVIASLELMMGRLPTLAGGPEGEQAEWFRRQLERANEGAGRVGVIVHDLKAFSRADDETVAVVDLRRTLDASISLTANEIKPRANIVRDYDGLPPVRANEARLGQVFVNLLMNAAQSIPPGAADRHEIRVSGHADAAGQAIVEIRDSGTGIATEHLGRIFEPFFTTKAVGLGTGLGLALCHGIVSSFGGQITVESTPGAGSLFRIVLPAAERDAPVERANDAKRRVLIIDDEEDLCEVLREALTPLHHVVTTTDARQALTLIADGQRFDLILCDVRMPKMTGLDFYAALLLTNTAQASRVVLMSGGFTRGVGEAPLALPVPILEKPFKLKAVLALLQERGQEGSATSAATCN